MPKFLQEEWHNRRKFWKSFKNKNPRCIQAISQMCCHSRCCCGGKFGTVLLGSARLPGQRCGQRLGVECDADVLSGDSVLGQSVIRSWRVILGQVILGVG